MSSKSSTSKEDRSSTQDWLESILEGHFSSKHPDKDEQLEVLDWDINPVDGEGYLCDVLSIDVRYSIGVESRRAYLVAKLLPQNPYNRAFVIQTQFDVREIKFYTKICPSLEAVQKKRMLEKDITPLPIPSCFHASYKEDSESILVMEDLKHKDYVHQELDLGLTLGQAEAAAVAIAQIHATSYVLQKDLEQDLDEKFPYLLSKEKSEEAFHSLFEKGLPLLLKYVQKKPEFAAVRTCLQDYAGNRSRDVFQRVLSPSKKLNTLVHCDFWSNNLMFKSSQSVTTCCIVDWQMLMRGRPAIDLGMLISTSLTPESRRSHESRIVRTYWSSFTTHLQKLGIKEKDILYSLDDFTQDVNDGKLFSALVMIGSIDIALGFPAREDRVLSLITDLMKEGLL